MILKKLIILTFTACTLLHTNAQTFEQKLNNWNLLNPLEKLYLHLDRESYIAGQSIWFKGYFMSEYVPSIKNSTVYVELLNNNNAVVLRKIFPAYLGVSIGQVEIPETFQSGSYQLRAYSPLMLNQPGLMYQKRVIIFGTSAKDDAKKNTSAGVTIEFFPEGGNLVASLLNNVAFKAIDQYGYPVTVSGKLKK